MEKIITYLLGCGFGESEAKKEAEQMIRYNQFDGVEMCSREFAIQLILDDLGI